jgi:hypothetical protein
VTPINHARKVQHKKIRRFESSLSEAPNEVRMKLERSNALIAA